MGAVGAVAEAIKELVGVCEEAQKRRRIEDAINNLLDGKFCEALDAKWGRGTAAECRRRLFDVRGEAERTNVGNNNDRADA